MFSMHMCNMRIRDMKLLALTSLLCRCQFPDLKKTEASIEGITTKTTHLIYTRHNMCKLLFFMQIPHIFMPLLISVL